MKSIRQPLLHAGVFFIGFILISAVLSFCSCKSSKVNKSKSEIRSDSSLSITDNTRKVSELEIADNSSSYITEKVDTIITTKETTLNASGTIEGLQKGDTIHSESETMDVKVYKDEKGKVKVKAKSKPQKIKVDKTKTTYIKTDQKVKSKTNESANKELKTEVSKVDKLSTVERKTTGSSPWWLWLLLVAVIIGGIIYLYNKYAPPPLRLFIRSLTGGMLG